MFTYYAINQYMGFEVMLWESLTRRKHGGARWVGSGDTSLVAPRGASERRGNPDGLS